MDQAPNKDNAFYDRLQTVVEVVQGGVEEVMALIVNADDLADMDTVTYLTTLADFLHLDLRFKIEEVEKNLEFFAAEKKRLTGIETYLREQMLATMQEEEMDAVGCNYGIKLTKMSTESLKPKRDPKKEDQAAWGKFIKEALTWKVADFKKALKEGQLDKKQIEAIGFEFVTTDYVRIDQQTGTPEFGD